MIDAETLAEWKAVAEGASANGWSRGQNGRILALIAEVERVSRYAPSPEVEALLARSSLGADDAKAARDSVSPDTGHLVVRLSQVMAERDEARAEIERLRKVIAFSPTLLAGGGGQ